MQTAMFSLVAPLLLRRADLDAKGKCGDSSVSHSSSHSSGGDASGRNPSAGHSSTHAPDAPKSESHAKPAPKAPGGTHPKSYSQNRPTRQQGKDQAVPSRQGLSQEIRPVSLYRQVLGRRPGYVIDHITPLRRGGADVPSNMQWQTKEAAKQKDMWE